MSFSGAEVTEKGFAKGWDPDAQDQEQRRLQRTTEILEAALFRPFAWKPHSSLGLRYAHYGGWVATDSGWVFAPDGTVTLTDNALNYIERSSIGVVSVNTSGFSAGAIPMAQIRAAGGSALPRTYVDCRPFGSEAAGGDGSATTFSQISGQILNSQVPASVVTQHQSALSIAFTQLTGQISDAQVPESAVTQHEAALSIDWTQLTGVPATFPPSAHTHPASEITAGTFAAGDFVFPAQLTVTTVQLTGVGSVGAPSYAFIGDPDTGTYRPGANTLGFAVGGVTHATFAAASSNFYVQADDGAVGINLYTSTAVSPRWHFSARGESWVTATERQTWRVFYHDGSVFNFIGAWSFNAGVAQLHMADGTAAAPIYSFHNDRDTGIYRPGPDQLAISAGNSTRALFGGTTSLGSGSAVDYALVRVQRTWTSGGASTIAAGLMVDSAMTGAAGDTGALQQLRVAGTITTQAVAEVVGIVATAVFLEPNITLGAGSSVTNATTIYVASAPTEGTNNYAVWVDSGIVRVDEQLFVGTSTPNYARFGVSGAFTSGGASTASYGAYVGVALTGDAGDSTGVIMLAAGSFVGASITVTGNAGIVATAHFSEPNITVSAGTVTAAATLYVQNAPTEGTSNYALWVDQGPARFDDRIELWSTGSTSVARLEGIGFHQGPGLSVNLSYTGSGDPTSAANWTYTNAAGANNAAGVLVHARGNGSESGTWFRVYTAPTSTGAGATPSGLNLRFSVDGTGLANIPGNLTVGGGPNAIGGSTLDYIRLRLTGTWTSGGAASHAAALQIDPAMTGAAGDSALSYVRVRHGSITTQASETIALVAGAYFGDPNIVVGSGATVTAAASVYVADAPTEGTSNYALWVDNGTTRFDGLVQVFGANGVDFLPGSDIDVDLLTVNVTGTPTVYWDESADGWVFEIGGTLVGLIAATALQCGSILVLSSGGSALAQLSASASQLLIGTADVGDVIEVASSGATPLIGFLGATATGRQLVSGSRGGNAALASLLTALDTLGLIDDTTT